MSAAEDSVGMPDMWTTIAAERGALADDLEGLSEHEWNAGSDCDEWTVEDVLAHMTSTASLTPPTVTRWALPGPASAFRRFAEKGIAKQRGRTSWSETLANFRAVQHSTKSPPGPKTSWLGETIAPCGRHPAAPGHPHTYPTDAVRQLLDFYKSSNALIGTKTRMPA